ncbi:MAG: HIT domain-containing protein, partial [Patescibacteria group bacterium]
MESPSSSIGTSCIFCKIVSGEIPATKIYEDENFLAFLDIHPQAPGHAQIIPKSHYRWVWDIENIGEYFEVVKKIAKAEQKAFGTDWILSKIIGDEVPHAHIWVFP